MARSNKLSMWGLWRHKHGYETLQKYLQRKGNVGVVTIQIRFGTCHRTNKWNHQPDQSIGAGASVTYYLVDLVLLNAGILEDLFNGLESFTEEIEIHVQLVELGGCQGQGEIIAVLEGLNLDLGIHLAR